MFLTGKADVGLLCAAGKVRKVIFAFVTLDSIQTQQSAKTLAFDGKTGKIFLPAATVVVAPAGDPSQKPKRTITEGTFAVLVVGKSE